MRAASATEIVNFTFRLQSGVWAYCCVQTPNTTKPSPSDEIVADILPVSSEIVIVHPRPS
jgi:hypothetical protein